MKKFRALVLATVGVMLTSVGLVVTPTAAVAAGAPSVLEAAVSDDGSVHLEWDAVPGATGYRLEVSADSEFPASAIMTFETAALDYITRWPFSPAEDGMVFWRVRSVVGTGATAELSEPSSAQAVSLQATPTPVPVAPGSAGNVETIEYPDPVVFRWEAVPGAVRYQLEYTSDTLGGGANVTQVDVVGTTFSPVNPLSRVDNNGNPLTWKWRVRAQFYDGNTNVNTAPYGVWSDAREFQITWDVAPTNLHPANEVTSIHSDLYFSWNAVPGAAKYEIALSSSEPVGGELVNPQRIEVYTTTYVPTAQVSDRNWYFQITPLDYAGNPGKASAVHEFKKKWGIQPAPTHPSDVGNAAPVSITGSTELASPELMYLSDFELVWEPLPRATFYQVELYGPGYTVYCRTPNTSATVIAHYANGLDNSGTSQVLKGAGDCLWNSAIDKRVQEGHKYSWRVRAIDLTGSSTYNYQSSASSAGTLPNGVLVSNWSLTRHIEIIADDRVIPETESVGLDLATFSADNPIAKQGAPAPVMTWNRSGMRTLDDNDDLIWENTPGYEVIVYKNAQRTAEVGRFRTPSTRLRINAAFQDNTTSNPYYASVRPIIPEPSWTSQTITLIGGPDNESSESFVWQKSANALTGLSHEVLTDGSVRLSWNPQSVTGVNDGGSRGYQIKIFNGEVQQGITKKIEFPFFMAQRPAASTDTTFPSSIADTPLPPGNNYSFEVAPLDANGDPGRVSRSGIFSVGIQVPQIPTPAAVSGGSASVRWGSVPGALKYSVQYRRIGGTSWFTVQNIAQTSLAITGLDQGNYEWQVRAHDASNQATNVSVWSASKQFVIGTGGVDLVTANNQVLQTAERILRWTSTADGASRYQVQVAENVSFTQGIKNYETTSLAFALPDLLTAGKQYYWRVHALAEPVGNANALKILTSSQSRAFTVRTVPGKLSRPRLTVEGSGLLVSWTGLTGANAGTTEPLTYRIEYRIKGSAANSDDWSSADVINTSAGATSWQLGNLSPGVVYEVRVAAVNSEGQGQWSDVVEGATASKPTAAPTLTLMPKLGAIDVRIGAISSSGNGGSAILGYKLRYKRTADSAQREVLLTANQRNYTISGLANNTSYDVSVLAYNGVGDGPAAGASESTLGVSSVPRNVRTKVDDGKVTVSWAVPSEPAGDITGYVVEYRSGSSGSWQGAGSAGANATSYTRSGLKNGQNYQFRVAARTRVGLGAYSAPVAAKPAGKPIAPTKITAKSNKKGKITVKWNKAKPNGEKLTRYTLQFSVNGTKWKKVKNFKPNKRKAKTTKGKRGKYVQFRVIAQNKIGKSTPSRAASVLRR